jgi:hypothetical protein
VEVCGKLTLYLFDLEIKPAAPICEEIEYATELAWK